MSSILMNSHISMKLSVYPTDEWMPSGTGDEKGKCSTPSPNFSPFISPILKQTKNIKYKSKI